MLLKHDDCSSTAAAAQAVAKQLGLDLQTVRR